jgi:hypothetical protein
MQTRVSWFGSLYPNVIGRLFFDWFIIRSPLFRQIRTGGPSQTDTFTSSLWDTKYDIATIWQLGPNNVKAKVSS